LTPVVAGAWIDPRHNYEQTFGSTLDARHADAIQPNTVLR